MEEKQVRTPYNFVSLAKYPLEYREECPPHDRLDPSLKTGEIHVTMTAQTPVYVAQDRNGGFFRGADGRYMLPGSTIRGMVRANMQVLGLGLAMPGEDFEDRRFFFRNIANARDSVGKELKDYYHTELGTKIYQTPSKKAFSIPEKVKAGYLYRQGGKLFIQPVQGSYLRISKKELEQAGLQDRHAEAIPVCYTTVGDRVGTIREHTGAPAQGMQQGTLLCPGLDTGGDGTRRDRNGRTKPPSRRYVFPLPDESASPLPVSREDELDYAADWEGRRNQLNAHGGAEFWRMPEEGKRKPVFYLCQGEHIVFGMSLFLRIGYSHSLKEGLPSGQREAAEQKEFCDYPRAILGFAGKEKSYRSRVCFGDFPAQGQPREMPEIKAILGGPNPGYFPGYTVDGKHYNEEFLLRGYKRYWLKKRAQAQEMPGKDRVNTVMHPLPEGTVFQGIIRYKNLRPHELGLLLWSLRLEEGCFQSVGMGKPYGFGRMRLQIDRLLEADLNMLYRPEGLLSGPKAAGETAVEDYIRLYDAFAIQELQRQSGAAAGTGKKKKQSSLRDRSEIQDFFFLCRLCEHPQICAQFTYMQLDEYRNLRSPLKRTAEYYKEAQKADEQARQAAERAEEDPLAKLLSINKRRL